MQLMRSHQHDR